MNGNADANEFKESIETDFAFLKDKYGFACSGIRYVDDDPRDKCLLARFTKGSERIDVACNELGKSLNILIRLCNDTLETSERYLHFEPFIAFLTNGKVAPIVPQLFPRMSMTSIDSTMRQRDVTFSEGIAGPMASLAKRLAAYLETAQAASIDSIRAYHAWYNSRDPQAVNATKNNGP